MSNAWLWIFIGSSMLLVFTTLRSRMGWRWVPALALNVAVAAVLLYCADLAQPYTHVNIPINAVTITAVAVLGLPGILMLALLKWVLF